MPIQVALGKSSSAPRVRQDWPLSRAVLPPALDPAQQGQLKGAIQAPPTEAGIELANWNWMVVRQFVQERFGLVLSRSTCK